MKAGDIILLLTLNSLLNKVRSNSQFENYDHDKFLSKSHDSKPHLKKPVLFLIDKKIESYEALQQPHESSHSDKVKIPPAFASNEGAGRSDSNSQPNQKTNSSIPWMQNSGIVAGIICTCLVLGLIFLLLVGFCIYRLRKRDEGSYALDEPKKMFPPSSEYSKAPTREFYA